MGGAEQQSQRKQIGDIMVYTRRKLTPRLRAVGCKNNDDVEEKEVVRKIDDGKDDKMMLIKEAVRGEETDL